MTRSSSNATTTTKTPRELNTMMTTATVTKTTLTSVTLKPAPIIDMGNIKLPQVIYKGQPVLTARAVAEILGTDRDNVQHRFAYNRKDFKKGTDYFKVTAAEAKAMGFISAAAKSEGLASHADLFRYSGTGVTLFTRRGALFLARYVTSPEALELYNTAMDAYFTLEGIATGSLSTREEAAQKAHEVVAKGASLLPGINPNWPETTPLRPCSRPCMRLSPYSRLPL
ncbi:ORF6N domain-containing protein [Laribacter hongkongensis]|uniref:ORF6N domain-containing protein n=1 Tax=Laribacter hongkongensis TaxID=168471 RepID=UPI001EFD45AF|nr:ORF6N domain-containing protein [Laribacter hongkongensis]MCG9054234.1 ORF6N domain-containing protein [Laribacter hongkongensis]